ncbi:hypothetical protein TYRP_016512 [Tyrophagus putrescentiae]|nr:hypothetical protein TYRP_016512 [Tyrophagus putrescentiae]
MEIKAQISFSSLIQSMVAGPFRNSISSGLLVRSEVPRRPEYKRKKSGAPDPLQRDMLDMRRVLKN